jgi:hypothetical protein
LQRTALETSKGFVQSSNLTPAPKTAILVGQKHSVRIGRTRTGRRMVDDGVTDDDVRVTVNYASNDRATTSIDGLDLHHPYTRDGGGWYAIRV